MKWRYTYRNDKKKIDFAEFECCIFDPHALFLMLRPNELSLNDEISLILKLFPRTFDTLYDSIENSSFSYRAFLFHEKKIAICDFRQGHCKLFRNPL